MTIKFNLDRVMFESNNMKVPELQELSGINKNTLYSFYKGDMKRFDAETIDKLCKALQCQPGDLISYEEDQDKIVEEVSDPLNDPIELLNLEPDIFNKIRKHYPKAKTVGQLLEKDRTVIFGLGPSRLGILEDTLEKYLMK